MKGALIIKGGRGLEILPQFVVSLHDDLLTQISTDVRALRVVAFGLLEGHFSHGMVDAAREGDPAAGVKEATEAIARPVRS
jgi:hypothetical protein